jgi:hypothetical protein
MLKGLILKKIHTLAQYICQLSARFVELPCTTQVFFRFLLKKSVEDF